MENRPGPPSQESSDEDDESSESPLVLRGAKSNMPRVPLRELKPPAALESRSMGFAAFMEQQRRAEDARRAAEEVAQSKEADDDQDQPKLAQDATLESANYTANFAEVAAVHEQEASNVHIQNQAEADVLLQPQAGQDHQLQAEQSEQDQHIDPAALEQLQREAEEYANALLTDAELAPALSEPGMETADLQADAAEEADMEAVVDAAGSAELTGSAIEAQEVDEDEYPVASTTGGAVPRPRAGSHNASSPAPSAPPPLMPIPMPRSSGGVAGGGVPVRPAGTTSSTGGGSGYGGGGSFSPSSPGMGPSSQNVLGGATGLAGNLLHSHEHWHPKTFFALAGAILVSDMLGRSRDRKITREMRERTDKLKQIIDQHTAESDQQHSALKRQAAEMQESYQDSRQKLASRLEQVTSHQEAADAQHKLRTEQVAAAPAPTVESMLRTNHYVAGAERRAAPVPSSERFMMRPINAMPNTAELAGMAARMPDVQPAGPIAPEIVPDTQRYAELQAQPNMVLEQVTQAAELGVSTEKVYERRQEVRDDPGANGSPQGGGAAAAGDPYVPGYGYQPASASSRQFADAQAQMAQGQSYQKPGSDKYRKAMQAGFWGGVAIIVLALIAVFAL